MGFRCCYSSYQEHLQFFLMNKFSGEQNMPPLDQFHFVLLLPFFFYVVLKRNQSSFSLSNFELAFTSEVASKWPQEVEVYIVQMQQRACNKNR